MSAKRTRATAIAFMKMERGRVVPRTLKGSMVDAIAATTRNIEPMNSAMRLRLRDSMIPPSSRLDFQLPALNSE